MYGRLERNVWYCESDVSWGEGLIGSIKES